MCSYSTSSNRGQPFHTFLQNPVLGSRDAAIEESLSASYYSSLHAMLPLCDFLLLSCSLTEETRGLIADKELEMMKESALLVNVARGKVIGEGIVAL